MKRNKTRRKVISAVTTGLASKKRVGNIKMGTTSSYSKETRSKLYDSTKLKSQFKEKMSSGRKSYRDPIEHKELHFNQKAAQRKYGPNHWTEHVAETDHVIPIKIIHKMASKNPFLNDGDIKRIANKECNYELLSKSLNAGKRHSTNTEVVQNRGTKKVRLDDAGKKELLRREQIAKYGIAADIAATTTLHAGQEFVSGAKDSIEGATIPLALMVYNHIHAVRHGDETAQDAIREIGKSILSIGTVGGINQVAKTAMAQSDRSWLKTFVDGNAIPQLWGICIVMSDSVKAFGTGEIDSKEFSKQVIAKSAGLFGGQMAGNIGAGIGSVICPGAGTAVGYVAGSAGAIYFQTCVQNLIDEIYGDGAFGAILNSSSHIYSTTTNLQKNVEKIRKDVRQTDSNIKEAQQMSAQIKSRRDEFEKLKGD